MILFVFDAQPLLIDLLSLAGDPYHQELLSRPPAASATAVGPKTIAILDDDGDMDNSELAATLQSVFTAPKTFAA